MNLAVLQTMLRDALHTRARKQEEFSRQKRLQQQQADLSASLSRRQQQHVTAGDSAAADTSTFGFDSNPDFEFLPWTAAPGPGGVRAALVAQFAATNDKALPLAEDSSARAALAAQMSDLADLVLDGYRSQLDRMPSSSSKSGRRKAVVSQFERDRRDLVMALVERGFYDSAASLAEKYLEFVGLIALCEATGDRARLDGYMEAFADQGFAQFVFSWHLREGKQAKLLKETPADRKKELGAFLRQGHSRYIDPTFLKSRFLWHRR